MYKAVYQLNDIGISFYVSWTKIIMKYQKH
jgi:hypothetical protein